MVPQRTVGDLLRDRETAAEERKRNAAVKAAREKAKREQQAAIARKKYLDGIAGTEHALWRKFETLVATKQPKSYDQAVALLVDLRDLAARERGVDIQSRLEDVRAEHARKPTLIKRMEQGGL